MALLRQRQSYRHLPEPKQAGHRRLLAMMQSHLGAIERIATNCGEDAHDMKAFQAVFPDASYWGIEKWRSIANRSHGHRLGVTMLSDWTNLKFAHDPALAKRLLNIDWVDFLWFDYEDLATVDRLCDEVVTAMVNWRPLHKRGFIMAATFQSPDKSEEEAMARYLVQRGLPLSTSWSDNALTIIDDAAERCGFAPTRLDCYLYQNWPSSPKMGQFTFYVGT